MIALMARAVLVAALVALAALAIERALPAGHRSRWIWACALLAASSLPWLGGVVPGGLDLIPWARLPGGAAAGIGAGSSVMPTAPEAGTPGVGLGTYLLAGWLVASAALVALFAISALRLRRALRASARVRLAGVPVHLTPDLGPAVVGVVRPRIAVPRWLLALSPPEIRLALDHEREHLRAGDTRLLACAALTFAAMPWNLPLWWLTRRLARAVEADCDARVLATHDAAEYGRLLLRVASFGGASRPAVLALAGAPGNLERRIMAMTSAPKRFHTLRGIPLLAAAAAALVAACDAADGPTAPDASALTPAAPQGALTAAEVARAKAVRETIELRLQRQPTHGLDLSGDLESKIVRAYRQGDTGGLTATGTLRPVEARFREGAVSRYELRAADGTRSGRRAEAAARLDGTPSQPATFKVKETAPLQR